LNWDFPEFAIPKEGDPSPIRREERRRRILAAGEYLKLIFIEPPSSEAGLAIRIANRDSQMAAVRRLREQRAWVPLG
jgi:hypothetical protein